MITTDRFANPLVYIEEMVRFPLQSRRRAIPGTVIVYGHSDGRLTAPKGGYTAGEAWWLGPLIAHHVDMTTHACALSWQMEEGGRKLQFEISGRWQVVDPVAVVANRVTNALGLCQLRFEEFLQMTEQAEGPVVTSLVQVPWRSMLAETIYLPEGITIDRLRVQDQRVT